MAHSALTFILCIIRVIMTKLRQMLGYHSFAPGLYTMETGAIDVFGLKVRVWQICRFSEAEIIEADNPVPMVVA